MTEQEPGEEVAPKKKKKKKKKKKQTENDVGEEPTSSVDASETKENGEETPGLNVIVVIKHKQ